MKCFTVKIVQSVYVGIVLETLSQAHILLEGVVGKPLKSLKLESSKFESSTKIGKGPMKLIKT